MKRESIIPICIISGFIVGANLGNLWSVHNWKKDALQRGFAEHDTEGGWKWRNSGVNDTIHFIERVEAGTVTNGIYPYMLISTNANGDRMIRVNRGVIPKPLAAPAYKFTNAVLEPPRKENTNKP